MHDLGWFVDQYVEFIDGEVIEMPAPGHEHCVSTDGTAETLRTAFGPGYWIRAQMPLDLDRQLEVHRNPIRDPDEPLGYRYADVTILGPNDIVHPLALPTAAIRVRDLLP